MVVEEVLNVLMPQTLRYNDEEHISKNKSTDRCTFQRFGFTDFIIIFSLMLTISYLNIF